MLRAQINIRCAYICISNEFEKKSDLMKKSLLNIAVIFALILVLSSCKRRKEACAAYNRVEMTQELAPQQ